jgi:hypothetical protein
MSGFNPYECLGREQRLIILWRAIAIVLWANLLTLAATGVVTAIDVA